MSDEATRFKVDKAAFKVTSVYEDDERAYWLSKTPEERLAALETMRQIAYGYDPLTTRFQGIFEVVQREWR